MNWDSPEERRILIESVGVQRYNEMLKEHHARSIVAVVNGHEIWPVHSRFGRLYMVGGTNRGFRTFDEAKVFAGTAKDTAP